METADKAMYYVKSKLREGVAATEKATRFNTIALHFNNSHTLLVNLTSQDSVKYFTEYRILNTYHFILINKETEYQKKIILKGAGNMDTNLNKRRLFPRVALGILISYLIIAGPSWGANFNVTVGPGGTFTFNPDTATITEGDTVTWTWASGVHTVTNGTGAAAPDAGILFYVPSNASNTLFVFQFNIAGTFPYFCRFHELSNMKGTVIVNPAGPAGPDVTVSAPSAPEALSGAQGDALAFASPTFTIQAPAAEDINLDTLALTFSDATVLLSAAINCGPSNMDDVAPVGNTVTYDLTGWTISAGGTMQCGLVLNTDPARLAALYDIGKDNNRIITANLLTGYLAIGLIFAPVIFVLRRKGKKKASMFVGLIFAGLLLIIPACGSSGGGGGSGSTTGANSASTTVTITSLTATGAATALNANIIGLPVSLGNATINK